MDNTAYGRFAKRRGWNEDVARANWKEGEEYRIFVANTLMKLIRSNGSLVHMEGGDPISLAHLYYTLVGEDCFRQYKGDTPSE